MASGRTRTLWIALVVAAGSRLALELLAMPPYAGLDEGFHVGRVSFVAAEGRNPTREEPSLPLYLVRSMGGDSSSPFDFAMLGARWPEAVAGRRERWPDPPVSSHEGLSRVSGNYEAQQPSLYYSIFGTLLRAWPGRTQLEELMLLRWGAGLFGLLGVAATAWVAGRLCGFVGLLAASLLVVAPAFLTLVCRAGNDALAVASAALGLALTLRRPATPAGSGVEALAWTAAVATKLTTWPFAGAVLVAGPRGRRFRFRILIVGAAIAATAGVTALDLHRRTGSAVDQGWSGVPVARVSGEAAIDVGTALKVFVASAIWPGAQHGNAMTGKAMLVYAGVALAILAVGLSSARRRIPCRGLVLTGLLFFALAQAGHAWGFLRNAARAGVRLPAGGFEGWYVWTLGPLLAATVFAAALRGLRRRPALIVALALWLLTWDVVIHEGALFRDYAGLTSPVHGSVLFRWGGAGGTSSGLEQLANLSASGAPFASLVALRALHLSATLLLLLVVVRRIGTRRGYS